MKKCDFLWQYVEYWAGVDPAFPAMHYGARTITYGEFEKLTDTLAKAFLDFGVRKGDTIATMLPSCPEYVMSLIAADKIGAILCAMDVKYKAADLRRFLSHIEPKVIVALSRSEDYDIAEALESVGTELDTLREIHYLMVGESAFGKPFDDVFREDYPDEPLKKAKANQSLDDGMLIVFTGGTTGVPKAALLSKQNVTAMATIEAEFLYDMLLQEGISGRVKSIASLPPSHVGGTVEMMGTIIAGGLEMIIHDSWSPARVLETTEAEKVPWMGGVPTMYAIMLLMPDLDTYDLSALKLAVLSGEKVEQDLLQLIRSKICSNVIIGYGSTEAGSEVTFTELTDTDEMIADGYVGKPLPGMEIRIVDDNDKELPPGEIGEVLTRGPLTIKGYFKMPEEDRAGFTGDGFCRTGDLGYLTGDGGLYIKGRKKHIIRVGSYTVMPAEVEEVVLQDSTVGMAAAIGFPDKVLGEVVWLVVSPAPGQTVDERHIVQRCENELAKFKVPKKVIVWDELPLTRIGKVHRVEVQNAIIASMKGKE